MSRTIRTCVWCGLVGALATTPGTLRAEESPLSVSGYLENNLAGDYRRERDGVPLLNNSRVRLALEAVAGRNIEINITAIGAIYSGETTFDLTEYLPKRDARQIPSELRPLFVYRLRNDIWLQEAFATLYAGDFRLRAGRQKIQTGPGYAYNPIDLFHFKNPLDPTYELEGVDALFASWSFQGFVELEGVYSFGTGHQRSRPYAGIEDGDWMLRLISNLGAWGFGLQYTAAQRPRTDVRSVLAGRVSPIDATTYLHWQLAAGTLDGEIANVGVHGEGGYAWVEDPPNRYALARDARDHFRGLVGIDYTFSWQLELLLEYMFDGQGRTGRERYTLNDRIGLLNGERRVIGRDTIFAGLRYAATDLLSLELYAIVTINDPSAIITPWLVWEAVEGLTVSATGQMPIGPRTSVNGRAGPGGLVRLRFSY